MKLIRSTIATLVLISFLHSDASAEVYRWVDKKGTVHFTDNPEELPEPQRTRVLKKLFEEKEKKKKEEKKPGTTTTRTPLRPGPSPATPNTRIPSQRTPQPSTTTTHTEVKEKPQYKAPEQTKEYWQDLVKNARANVNRLEKLCKALQTKKDQSSKNSIIFARPVDRSNKEKYTKNYEKCVKDLEEAKIYLDTGLPERARRLDIPPGWLR